MTEHLDTLHAERVEDALSWAQPVGDGSAGGDVVISEEALARAVDVAGVD